MRERLTRVGGLLLALTLMVTGAAWGHSYKDPVPVDWLNFTAVLTAEGYVEMHWTPYNNTEDFKFYKVVRSTTNPDPVYPDDGYIKYYGNIDADSYTDKNPPKGTVYYRVCVITKGGDRWVSNVVTIENSGGLKTITVTLSYREDVGAVDVKWTRYEGDDFETYEVYRSSTSNHNSGGIKGQQVGEKCTEKDWDLIATLNDANLTLYSDFNAEPGLNYYKVVVNLEGGREIVSNEASINIPQNGGEEPGGDKFQVKFEEAPEGIVDCCNCSISFSWKAEGGSGNYRYQYQLAGYRGEWSDWSDATSATFENLPQGTYTFMVICEDTTQHKIALIQNTFTVRCEQSGDGTIPTANISLYEHDLLGKKAVDLKITTRKGSQRNVVDLYFGLIYPTGHFRCLILGDAGLTLGPEDSLEALLKSVEMFDIEDPVTLYTYVVPDNAPKGEYLWVVLFTDSTKNFFNPDWIVSYDVEGFSVE